MVLNFQDDFDLVRDQLLEVKGVITITFDTPKRRCILRVRNEVKPEVQFLVFFPNNLHVNIFRMI